MYIKTENTKYRQPLISGHTLLGFWEAIVTRKKIPIKMSFIKNDDQNRGVNLTNGNI